MNENYRSGYRFGISYANNYGTHALLRAVRRDSGCAMGDGTVEARSYWRAYIAGMVDAALALVQGAHS